MIIRLEEENDWFEVENLTREALWNVYQPGCVEHLVLHNFRKHPDFIEELSFVMEEEGSKRLVAHIMYCRAVILSDSGAQKEILMFWPCQRIAGITASWTRKQTDPIFDAEGQGIGRWSCCNYGKS